MPARTPRRRPSALTTTPRPRATGHPGYSETHPRQGTAAEAARRLARDACATWGLDGDTSSAAALILSELATNAVRHARGPSIRIVVERPAEGLVYLAVVDRSPRRLPVLREPGEDETSGRGLFLVDAFAARWGHDLLGAHQRPWGKRVFAELELKP